MKLFERGFPQNVMEKFVLYLYKTYLHSIAKRKAKHLSALQLSVTGHFNVNKGLGSLSRKPVIGHGH